MGLAQLRQPSRLVADHSALLLVLQLYPLAMSFVYGIDPDSHLLGGWQLDPIKLKSANNSIRCLTPPVSLRVFAGGTQH